MKIKINNVPRHSGVVTLVLDENGKVKSKFWRRRLKDAEIDNCVEIINTKSKRKGKELKDDHHKAT